MQYLVDGGGKGDGGGGGEIRRAGAGGRMEVWGEDLGRGGGVKSVERLVVWGQGKIGDQGDVGGILGTGEKWTKKL